MDIQNAANLVSVKVADLLYVYGNEWLLLVLRESDGNRVLPIGIGGTSGWELAYLLGSRTLPRPLSSTVTATIISALEGELQDVLIHNTANVELASGSSEAYLASLRFRREGELLEVDARPSDAIPVAMQSGCPIFVTEELMQGADARHKAPLILSPELAADLGVGLRYVDRLMDYGASPAPREETETEARDRHLEEKAVRRLITFVYPYPLVTQQPPKAQPWWQFWRKMESRRSLSTLPIPHQAGKSTEASSSKSE